jgi:hypothetical protein
MSDSIVYGVLGGGAFIGNVDGALNIHDADVHSLTINQYFHYHTTLASQTSVLVPRGSINIPLVDSVPPFTIGSELQIGEESNSFPQVLSVGTGTIGIDRPLDYDIPQFTTITKILTHFNVLGTLALPVSYKMYSHTDDVIHLISFIIGLTHSSAADDSAFGHLPKLTNGCVLRGYNAKTDTFRTFAVWKSNGDLKMDMHEVIYTDKVGGGLFGVNGNGEIKSRTGSTPKLATGDYLELLIQDDLRALITGRLKGQGHVEAKY